MNLVIADFSLKLYGDTPIYMDEGYTPFLKDEKDSTPDMDVECISGIPANLFDDSKTLFEAKSETQRFYSVVKYGTGLGLSCTISKPSMKFSNWPFWMKPSSTGKSIPNQPGTSSYTR